MSVREKLDKKITQSKRACAGSLAIVDQPQVTRTCVLRAFGLQMSCLLSLAGVTFVLLFCFVFVFMPSLKPRPFVQSSFDIVRNLVGSKHQIQPEYGDKQADAGRDCRTRLARPNSQARTRTGGNIYFPCSADHVQDWQSYPVDPYSCYMCEDYDHTCIHASRQPHAFLPFFLFLDISLFPMSIFVPLPFSLSMESSRTFSPLPDGVFSTVPF